MGSMYKDCKHNVQVLLVTVVCKFFSVVYGIRIPHKQYYGWTCTSPRLRYLGAVVAILVVGGAKIVE
jgi:hypothetical protein